MSFHGISLALSLPEQPLTWILAGAGLFALVGLVFGAAVYYVGRRGGSRFGSALADTLGPLPKGFRRAAVGALDGAVFLGLVGLLVSMLAGPRGVLYGLVALVLLIVGTFIFAGLAQNLSGRGNPVVTALCVTLIGTAVGSMVTNGNVYGALAGGVAGCVAGSVIGIGQRRSTPTKPANQAADEESF